MAAKHYQVGDPPTGGTSAVSLLEQLREAGDLSVKAGCEAGHCGACMVIINTQLRYACLTLPEQVRGQKVETPGSLVGDQDRDAVAAALEEECALQCGYCTPGLIVSLVALVRQGQWDPATVDETLRIHHCRCTGYYSIKRAVAALASQPSPSRERLSRSDSVVQVLA